MISNDMYVSVLQEASWIRLIKSVCFASLQWYGILPNMFVRHVQLTPITTLYQRNAPPVQLPILYGMALIALDAHQTQISTWYH